MPTQKLIFFFFLGSLIVSGCASTTLTNDSQNAKPLELSQCAEGISRQGFISPTNSGNSPCAQGTQTCISGQWQGPTLFSSCENFTKSCEGQPHGSVVNGFMQPTAPHGTACTPATKTCLNGSWSGPEVFPNCSEI